MSLVEYFLSLLTCIDVRAVAFDVPFMDVDVIDYGRIFITRD